MALHRRDSALSYSTRSTLVAQNKAFGSVLYMLGMRDFLRDPLDLTSMTHISNLTLEDDTPEAPNFLLQSFLRRLWLYHPQARNPCCVSLPEDSWSGTSAPTMERDPQGEPQPAVNPLDLITGAYMSSNSFLRQEITNHMVQCNFAVPLLLPAVWPDVQGTLMLWPFRNVTRLCTSASSSSDPPQVKNMASSRMPLISSVRVGDCGISKSRVLNKVLSGPGKRSDFFIHGHMDGSKIPRSIADGMIEVGWNPNGDTLSRPMVLANLRGNASDHDRPLSLLCRGSGVIVVFFRYLREDELTMLNYCRSLACHMILVDCSTGNEDAAEQRKHEKMLRKAVKELELERGLVVTGCRGDEDEIALHLIRALELLIPHLHAVNLVDLAGISVDLGYNVDEDEICRLAYDEAENVLKGMEDDPIQFKMQQLPLQGGLWKQLNTIEKEQCRAQEREHPEAKRIRQELREHAVTPAMKAFIDALITLNTLKRAYFLNWMKARLDMVQWDQVSASTNTASNQQPLIEIEGYSPGNTFLGLEHFFREMGLMYELCFHSASNDSYVLRLPNLAADLLLFGVPLELYDGDASGVPINWLNAVMVNLQKKLPLNMRTKTVTSLGLHHSKNAEVLSTVFGTNFMSGNYRHAKGVYMLPVVVPEMLSWEMQTDLLILINTEGLSNTATGNVEEMRIHDQELATFVCGIGDVLLLNLKTENSREVQQMRQLAVGGLLRTNEIGRLPVCRLMNQSDDAETKALSQHLGRTFQILLMKKSELGSESQTSADDPLLMNPKDDSVLYRPLEPEGTGAALELKNRLYATTQSCAMANPFTFLPNFVDAVNLMWDTIKREPLPIPFNNTHIIDTFSTACDKLLDSERDLEKHMESWFGGVDNRISDQLQRRRNSEDILRSLEDEAAKEIESEGKKIHINMEDHFKRNDIDFQLVNDYKASFIKYAQMYKTQKTDNLNKTLESVKDDYDVSSKVAHLKTAIEAALESKLRELLTESRMHNAIFLDSKLEEEFANIWNGIPTNVDQKTVEKQDIVDKVKKQLFSNLRIRVLQKYIDKLEYVGKSGVSDFEVRKDHFGFRSKVKRTLQRDKQEAPKLAARVIEQCEQSVLEKVKRKENYSDGHTKDILGIVDREFGARDFNVNSQFEIDLKVHVCNKAALSFLELQDKLVNQMNSKERFLVENKDKYMLDFMYQFRKRDQCQKAASAFTNLCLKPVAQNYIQSSIGQTILEDILRKDEAGRFASPSDFHYNILKDLIIEDNFDSFFNYLRSGDTYCRNSIQAMLNGYFSGTISVDDRRKHRKEEILDKIKRAIKRATEDPTRGQGNIRELLVAVSDHLAQSDQVNLPREPLQGPLFDINTHCEVFIANLQDSLNTLSQGLAEDLRRTRRSTSISPNLPHELRESLFEQVGGCGEECPFCKAPCDVADKNHTLHSSLWHRPKGLLSYSCSESASLSHSTCSQEVGGDNMFVNKDTGGKSIAYKDYSTIYPNWFISVTDVDGDYWKYVLMRFNDDFAKAYQRDPADIPDEWRGITRENALDSLHRAFHTLESYVRDL